MNKTKTCCGCNEKNCNNCDMSDLATKCYNGDCKYCDVIDDIEDK
jgi:hypothetical protein